MTATSLLSLALQCSMLGMVSGLQPAISAPAGCEGEVIQGLVDEIGARGRRLVVTELREGEGKKQEDLARNGAIDKLDCAMSPRNLPSGFRIGAELVRGLTLGSDRNRVLIAETPHVIQQLAQMVHWSVHFRGLADIIVEGAESAAEAIWSLSRTGIAGIHRKLNLVNVTDDLARMLERDVPPMTPEAYMWAGAALGSLTKQYLEDGVDLETSYARAKIAQRPGFIQLLLSRTREGSAGPETRTSEMPSNAVRSPESRNFPKIYGWGTMSALASLALDDHVREQLAGTPGAHELFCNLSASHDPLERGQAVTILQVAFNGSDCRMYAGIRAAEAHAEGGAKARNKQQKRMVAGMAKGRAGARERVAAKEAKKMDNDAKAAGRRQLTRRRGKTAADAKAAATKQAQENAGKMVADGKAAATKQAQEDELHRGFRESGSGSRRLGRAKDAGTARHPRGPLPPRALPAL